MSWENLFDETDAHVKEAKEFGVIAEGEYTGFVLGAKLDETRMPPQVSIQWRLVDDGAFKNRHVFANYTMNDKGIPFLKSDMLLMDIPNVTAKTLVNDLSKLIGRSAKVYVKPKPKGDKIFYSVFINEHLTKDAAAKAYPQTVDTIESLPF